MSHRIGLLVWSCCLTAVAWLGLLSPTAAALEFSWSATADTLDWFEIDNPDVGNSGWTLLPNFITTQASLSLDSTTTTTTMVL